MEESTQTHAATPIPWAFFRLSPFPQIAIRVMQMVNREEVPLDKVSNLIASDPAFASELLTIANSPLYAPRVPATSVLQAVSRIGTRNIQGLCLTVAVRAYLGQSIHHPAMQAMWHHILATALVAEELAIVFSGGGQSMDKDLAYTAGIMHDIGRLAMAVLRPGEYAALLQQHQGSASSILEAEWGLFGFDHCQAGHQLIESWNLPLDFASVVAHHHTSTAGETIWTVARLVNLSCRLADTAGFPAFQHCEAQPYADLVGELPEPIRGRLHPDVAALTAEIHDKIAAVERPEPI